MPRRRRDDYWRVAPIIQLVAIVALACIFVPGVRQTLFSYGATALICLGIVGLCLVVIAVLRLRTLERTSSSPANVVASSVLIPVQQSVGGGEEQRQPSQPSSTVELIEQLRSMDWFQFEKLVGHVYQKLGYAVTRRGGANPDGGIDLIIEKDGQRSAVQCKQWKKWTVGVKPIREFLGAMTHENIRKGVFITLRGYTGEAKQLAKTHAIEIVNEMGLAQLLESTDARIDPLVLELLHDKRKFCPKCERELRIQVARKGPNPGSKFWGCSSYPRCRFKMSIA